MAKLKALNVAKDIVDQFGEVVASYLKRELFKGPELHPNVAAASFWAYIDEIIYFLRKGTKEVSEKVEELIERIIMWVDDLVATVTPPSKEKLLGSWDEIARVSGRGRKYGQKLVKRDLEKIELYLKWKKCDLQLFPKRGTFEVEGFVLADGRTALLDGEAAAMLITDGVNTKMCLREGATLYEFFHEYMHLKHSKDLGLKKYHKLGGKYTPGELVKEQYVFERILENKEYFTKEELKDAFKYYNRIRNTFGQDITDLDFDIEDIPEIRKEVKVEKLLKK